MLADLLEEERSQKRGGAPRSGTRALSREWELPPSPPPSPQKQKRKQKNKKDQKQSLLSRSSVSNGRAPVIAPAALGGSGDVACGHHGSGKERGEKKASVTKLRGVERESIVFISSSACCSFACCFSKKKKKKGANTQSEQQPALNKQLAMRSAFALLVLALCAVACTSGE